jgi:hypothetical protein
MAPTIFKMQLRFFLAFFLLSGVNAAAIAQGAGVDSFVSEVARLPFKQTPLHGQIDGIDFKPVIAESVFMRLDATSGHKSDGVNKISFKDGGGRQIDVTVYNSSKFEDAIYTQSVSTPAQGSTNLGVAIDLRNLNRVDFGIRLSLGKLSAARVQPVYIIFRLDRNNWLEGYIYAQVHERVLF